MKWIKTSEQLPPLETKVIVYGYDLKRNEQYLFARMYDALDWNIECGYSECNCNTHITHWMSLPPKPD